MTKRIVLCADDYGQAPAISRGIVTLIQLGRLTATSCMVNSPYWPEHGKWLKSTCESLADIGLHFNLTEGRPLSDQFKAAYGDQFWSLPGLIRKALFRRLDTVVLAEELNAQLNAFEEVMGRAPDFIDGHQHVHQFPIVRAALVKVYQQRFKERRPYIRLVNESITPLDLLSDFKKLVIEALGTPALRKLLIKHKIPHNNSFAGIYRFEEAPRYAEIFPQLLASVKEKGLIMCHPGMEGRAEEDSIAEARFHEYQYLAGNQFMVDCRAAKVSLGRFR